MNHQRFCFRATGLALVLSAATLSPAWASSHQGVHGAHGDHGKPAAQAANGEMADGEVRKVDKRAAKLTRRHGEIKPRDMPPRTMVFNVRDRAVLDQSKAGDKVRFRAVNDAGKYTVTDIERAD